MTRVRIALVMNECGQWAAYGDSDGTDELIDAAIEALGNITDVAGGTVVQWWIEANIPALPVIEGEVTA